MYYMQINRQKQGAREARGVAGMRMKVGQKLQFSKFSLKKNILGGRGVDFFKR